MTGARRLTFDLWGRDYHRPPLPLMLHHCSNNGLYLFSIGWALASWHCYFCNLKKFGILTFDPLTVGRMMGSPWTLLHVYLCPTHWHCYFCYLKEFEILTFFDLWPLDGRSHNGVTVDTLARLFLPNKLTLLFLQFEKVWNFDLFWPLTP